MKTESSTVLDREGGSAPIEPLSELGIKQTAIIRDLRGGVGFRGKLAALGFTPGAEITMLYNRGHGPVIIALRGARIALGRGEAYKIWVSPR